MNTYTKEEHETYTQTHTFTFTLRYLLAGERKPSAAKVRVRMDMTKSCMPDPAYTDRRAAWGGGLCMCICVCMYMCYILTGGQLGVGACACTCVYVNT